MAGTVTVSPARTTAVATLSTVACVMPAFLTGASGVFLRAELGFDEAGLGLAVAAFMTATALSSALLGRLAERLGAGNVLVVSSLSSAAVLLGISVLARNLFHLAALLAIGGLCNAATQPAANLALARGAAGRPALMFGVKQSAIPVATLLAGASVPLISLTVGVRWAFAAGAAFAVAVAWFVPRRLAPALPRTTRRVREGDAAIGPLVALAVAMGVGTAAAVSIGAFLVESAVAGGMAASAAGWLLVVGSVSGILSRLFVGWLSDRFPGRALYTVVVMLSLGGVGYALLSISGPALLIVGTLFAYAAGWGWTGLMFFAVVRLNPNAPAAATGIVQAGGAGGSAIGPLVFGYVVTISSYTLAWSLAAGAAFLSALLVLLSRIWLLRDRARREAAA